MTKDLSARWVRLADIEVKQFTQGDQSLVLKDIDFSWPTSSVPRCPAFIHRIRCRSPSATGVELAPQRRWTWQVGWILNAQTGGFED
jgi:hypothetical protein